MGRPFEGPASPVPAVRVGMGFFVLRKAGAALIVASWPASWSSWECARSRGPALAYAAEDRNPEVLAAIRDKYGLDDPQPVQYVRWIGLALQGDLGTDSRGLPVAETIVTRPAADARACRALPPDRGPDRIPAGVIAAVRRGKASDYAATGTACSRSGPALLARAADDRSCPRSTSTGCPPGLRAVPRGSNREPRAHAHARARPGHWPRCRADAPDALGDADLARGGLRPDGVGRRG